MVIPPPKNCHPAALASQDDRSSGPPVRPTSTLYMPRRCPVVMLRALRSKGLQGMSEK